MPVPTCPCLPPSLSSAQSLPNQLCRSWTSSIPSCPILSSHCRDWLSWSWFFPSPWTLHSCPTSSMSMWSMNYAWPSWQTRPRQHPHLFQYWYRSPKVFPCFRYCWLLFQSTILRTSPRSDFSWKPTRSGCPRGSFSAHTSQWSFCTSSLCRAS